jgi:four helix bundle protein
MKDEWERAADCAALPAHPPHTTARYQEDKLMQDFRNLRVCQQAHQLVLSVYPATRDFPDEERYGLMSRIRRICISIPERIAYGCGCATDADFATRIMQAISFACALEYDLLLARDLGFLNDLAYTPLNSDLIEVKKMLSGLLRTLEGDR